MHSHSWLGYMRRIPTPLTGPCRFFFAYLVTDELKASAKPAKGIMLQHIEFMSIWELAHQWEDIRIGSRAVRYRVSDLNAYIDSRRQSLVRQ